MEATTDLNPRAWNISHKIADRLITQNVPLSELSKVITYLRAYQHEENAAKNFEEFIQTLITSGKEIGHGNDAQLYYRNIQSACSDFLFEYTKDPATMLEILGWTSRLMRYYTVSPIAVEENLIPEQKRQASALILTLEEIISATVIRVEGTEIKYEVKGHPHPLKERNRKLGELLKSKIGQEVKVRVTEVDENGNLRKVRYHE